MRGSHHQRERVSFPDNPVPPYPASHESNDRSSHPNASPKSLEGKYDQERDNRTKIPTWHPFWLRPVVLGVFSLVLLCCMIAIPVMMSISKRNRGLVQVRHDLEMLWRFTPTAAFTIISILWARVEYQTLRYFPRMNLQKGEHSSEKGGRQDTDLLDYTSMMPPRVLFCALRKRHFLVFLVSIISLICKVQVVLAPSLFYSTVVDKVLPHEFKVLDSFNLGEVSIEDTDPVYEEVRAIRNYNMAFPYGATKEAAFQTFRPLDGSQSRGTAEKPITAVVDGLFMDVDCLPMEKFTPTVKKSLEENYFFHYWTYNYTIDIDFPGCNEPITVEVDTFWNGTFRNPTSGDTSWRVWQQWSVSELRNTPLSCSSLEQNENSFLYFATHIEQPHPDLDHMEIDPKPNINAFGAILCTPKAWVTKVEVTDNGTSSSLSLLPDQDKIYIAANPWELIRNFIPLAYGGRWYLYTKDLTRGGMRQTEGAVSASLLLDLPYYSRTNGSDLAVYDTSYLSEAVSKLTKSLGPMIAHRYLRKDGEGQLSGTSDVRTSMLQLNRNNCIAMSVLLALSTLVALWVLLQCRGAFSGYHRDPATVLGSMAFIQSGDYSIDSAAGFESRRQESMKTLWSQSVDSPLPLATWLRILFCLYSLALIISLGMTLKMSNAAEGLASIDEKTWSVWWTSIPVLTMVLVNLYASSSDTAIRSLATHTCLSLRSCSALEMDTSLLDMLGLRALYYSFRFRVYTVTISQVIAIICGVLTSLSSVLFTVQGNPNPTSYRNFTQQSWFSATRDGLYEATDRYMRESVKQAKLTEHRGTVKTLLLAESRLNVNWPNSTYRDLVFPAIDIEDSFQDWDEKNNIIKVKMPAAKLGQSCIEIPREDIKIEIINGTNINTTHWAPAKAILRQDLYCPNGTTVNTSIEVHLGNISPVYFGTTLSNGSFDVVDQRCDNSVRSASDSYFLPDTYLTSTYAWGLYLWETGELDYLSVQVCNYTWNEIQTEVTFNWLDGELKIDPETPPILDNSTTQLWEPAFSVPIYLESVFPNLSFTDQLAGGTMNDNRFDSFVLSPKFRYSLGQNSSLKLADLGDPDSKDKVLEALGLNSGIVAAQLVNMEERVSINASSGMKPYIAPKLAPVEAQIFDRRTRRLVQSAGVTYTLIAILSLTLLVNLSALISTILKNCFGKKSWPLDMELKGVAPDEFNSVAMTESLLHGSNFLAFLPEDASLLSKEELHRHLNNIFFQMGWFWTNPSETDLVDKVFTVGVLNDRKWHFLHGK